MLQEVLDRRQILDVGVGHPDGGLQRREGEGRLVRRPDTGATPGTKGNDYAGGGTRLCPTAGIAVFQLGQLFGSPGEFQTQGSILVGKPGGLRQSGGRLFPLGIDLFPRNGGFILCLLGLTGVDYAGQHDAGAS